MSTYTLRCYQRPNGLPSS